MKIVKEKIREDFKRDTYWTRIYFKSDDNKEESTVLTCTSWEFILDINRINKVEKKHLEQWIKDVVKKWKLLGDKIFDKRVHYDVYANTLEGEVNGLEFLSEIRA